MKKILFTILVSVLYLQVRGQSPANDEKTIMEFLSYVATKNWSLFDRHTMHFFDTLTDRHLIFYKNDTTNLKFRRQYVLAELKRLNKQLHQVKKKDLQIVPYNDAPDSLQIMQLSPSYRDRSYIAFDRTGSFRRYFLMEEGKIDAFVLWGKTAFAKLN
ncbi:hypothetical protein [Chitinophaga sp.]|uniref:hypothetical protein n=1 Tax=Chitinophaga sp. TaxID=1869181 RepID=UPI0031CF4D4D